MRVRCSSDSRLRIDTLRRRRMVRKMKIATAQPPFTGVGRGVSNGKGRASPFTPPNSARNRFLLHLHPFQGAPVGSNTETDDDCRPTIMGGGKDWIELVVGVSHFLVWHIWRENNSIIGRTSTASRFHMAWIVIQRFRTNPPGVGWMAYGQ